MRNLTEANLTEAALGKLEGAGDARFKQIMTSLIRHLHAFVRETELSEEEWLEGIRFLTETGQKCDAKRQEFILLSDTLAVSMLVDAIQHRKPRGATESTVFGPFYVPGAPELPSGADNAHGAPGEPAFVSGRVTDGAGKPVAGAVLDVWGVDGQGFYDVQRTELNGMRVRGRYTTDSEGRYSLRTLKPVSYPIPIDGPVGRMLLEMGRHPYRPAHIHFMLSAPGYKSLITHLFVESDPYLDSDAVFGVKNSLVVDFKKQGPGQAPDGTQLDAPFYTACYDFGLEPAA